MAIIMAETELKKMENLYDQMCNVFWQMQEIAGDNLPDETGDDEEVDEYVRDTCQSFNESSKAFENAEKAFKTLLKEVER